MDKIAIFGVPRSGTTWLSQILNSHPAVALRFQPLFSYRHKGSLSDHSSPGEIRKFFEDIFCTQDPFIKMVTEFQKNYPIFQKTETPTHIVFKETRYLHIIENMLSQCDEVKVIGIVRNPMAVLASWVLAPKEFNSEWDINKEWRYAPSKNQKKPEEFYGFEKWKESAEKFLRLKSQFPLKFLLVNYNELNRAPLSTTKEIFDFCRLIICDQVQEFLFESKSRHDSDPYSVYRSNANDSNWQGLLPDEIAEQITMELKDSPLGIYLQVGTNA